MPILRPYKTLDILQKKRLMARRHDTTYCYDFPKVFNNAIHQLWSEYPHLVPPNSPLVHAEEITILGDNNDPFKWDIHHISNDIGIII